MRSTAIILGLTLIANAIKPLSEIPDTIKPFLIFVFIVCFLSDLYEIKHRHIKKGK